MGFLTVPRALESRDNVLAEPVNEGRHRDGCASERRSRQLCQSAEVSMVVSVSEGPDSCSSQRIRRIFFLDIFGYHGVYNTPILGRR